MPPNDKELVPIYSGLALLGLLMGTNGGDGYKFSSMASISVKFAEAMVKELSDKGYIEKEEPPKEKKK